MACRNFREAPGSWTTSCGVLLPAPPCDSRRAQSRYKTREASLPPTFPHRQGALRRGLFCHENRKYSRHMLCNDNGKQKSRGKGGQEYAKGVRASGPPVDSPMATIPSRAARAEVGRIRDGGCSIRGTDFVVPGERICASEGDWRSPLIFWISSLAMLWEVEPIGQKDSIH